MKYIDSKSAGKNLPRRLGMWALIVSGVLLIPLLLRAPWSGNDFVFAGIVLFGSATAYELTTLSMKNTFQKAVVGICLGLFIMLVWAWAVA